MLGANLLGDGLRDTLDPRLRGTGDEANIDARDERDYLQLPASLISNIWLAGMFSRVWVLPLGQRTSILSTVVAPPSPNSRSRLSIER